jgi:hypothetical protein
MTRQSWLHYLLGRFNWRLLEKDGGRWDEDEEGEEEHSQDGGGDTAGRRRPAAGGAACRCRCDTIGQR